MVDLRTKLAVFWLFIAVTMSANTLLYLVVPGIIDQIRSGKIVGMQAGPELILGMAVAYYWVPLVMSVVSLTLNDRASRGMNVIIGVFYVVFTLFELTMNVTTVAYPYASLMDISVMVVAALIVWNAWKWKLTRA